jgi:FolB domain-containing protein
MRMNAKDTLESLDKIHITDLRLSCIIGLNDWERAQKQDVLINITLFADLARACLTDRIEDSVDYKEIKKQVIAAVENSSFFLIERMAESIAQVCLSHASVKAVRVKVDKPGALRYAKSVGVEIFRMRDDG